MNKELSKAIMYRSKLRNIHNKKKTKETWEAFKRQRNKCVSIKRRIIWEKIMEQMAKCFGQRLDHFSQTKNPQKVKVSH